MSFEVITTQEEFDVKIGERLKREREKIINQFSDYEELKTKKLELEKQVGDLTKNLDTLKDGNVDFENTIKDLESQVNAHRLSELKIRYALENGIPYNLATRLNGNDEDSIKEDAVKLSNYFKSQTPPPPLKVVEPVGDGKDESYKNLLKNLESKGE